MVAPIRDARFVDLILADHRGSSGATLASAPGTGLESAETGRQNRRYRELDRQQRPHVAHLNPRKRPQSARYSSETGKHRFSSECVVVQAAVCEPVSAPQNREFSRFWAKNREIEPPGASNTSNLARRVNDLCYFPVIRPEWGIDDRIREANLREQGHYSPDQDGLSFVPPAVQSCSDWSGSAISRHLLKHREPSQES